MKRMNLSKESETLMYFMPLYVIIMTCGFLLNLYIMIIIFAYKKMHISVNFFIASASASSVLTAVFSMPFELILLINNFEWILGYTMCQIWYILDFSACTINLLKLIVVTFIRFMAIIKPHSEWAPKNVQILIFILIWILPLVLWSIVFSIFLDTRSAINKCYLRMKYNIADISAIILFLIPLLILVALNVKLIWELRKRLKRVSSGPVICI